VTGRTEAVVRAARWGVLDGGSDEVEVTELRPRHVVAVGTGS